MDCCTEPDGSQEPVADIVWFTANGWFRRQRSFAEISLYVVGHLRLHFVSSKVFTEENQKLFVRLFSEIDVEGRALRLEKLQAGHQVFESTAILERAG